MVIRTSNSYKEQKVKLRRFKGAVKPNVLSYRAERLCGVCRLPLETH